MFGRERQALQTKSAKTGSRLVTLDVLVQKRSTGQTVANLDKRFFSVYEDGVKQDIEDFGPRNAPASIVLLLDLSRSMDKVLSRIRDAAPSVWNQFEREDEVAIMTFAKNVEIVQPLTKDRQMLGERIRKIYTPTDDRDRGQTNMDEAIYQAATYLGNSSSTGRHREVLVISDGMSNQEHGHSRKEALRALFACSGVVYSLITTDAPYALLDNSLRDYVIETGGQIATVENLSLPYLHKIEIAEKLGALINLLPGRYRLAYRPSNQKTDGKHRKIKVTVSSDAEKGLGKLVVLSRRGYYAE